MLRLMENMAAQKRKSNTEAFQKWALMQESLRKAKTILAAQADVSISMVEKLINGTYNGIPRQDARMRICRTMNISEEILFPLLAQRQKKAS